MSKIYAIQRALPNLSAQQFVHDELPYTQALYPSEEALHDDVAELFEFYIRNQQMLPMYGIDEDTADQLLSSFSTYNAMLEFALRRLFEQPTDVIRDWCNCSAVHHAGFDNFLAYAKHSFAQHLRLPPERRNDTVYGRIDAAVDPTTGKVKGVYEFNGDTPVMLFESVNLQNLIAEAIGNPEAQANDWWPHSEANLSAYEGKAVAVVCDVNFIEDAVTAETIAQLFEAVGARVYFTTPDGLNHDVLQLEKPFVVDGVSESMDAVFMLLPWEEMWTSGNDILLHWANWSANVHFFEPPWRWFMAHKGLLAWVTHLFDTDPVFKVSWSSVPHLATYKQPDNFVAQQADYVAKPVIGRLSQNIRIVRNGETVEKTDGIYGDEPMVYQAYMAPGQVEGRNNFIVGAWLSGATATTLCFREFDGAVLDLKNERFIAHELFSTT